MNTIELYSFKTFDISAFISKYLYEITPHEVLDESSLSCYAPAKMKLSQAKDGAKAKAIIENKCLYLQDLIIRQSFIKEDRSFNLNSTVLKKVLGNEYKTLLSVLIDMGYLVYGKYNSDEHFYYIPLQYSMLYSIPKDVEVMKLNVVNFTVKKYQDKASLLLSQITKTNVVDEMDKRYGVGFHELYLKSLNKFKIEDVQGFDRQITEANNQNSFYSFYLQFVKDSFSDKSKAIYKVDTTGRIYHLLSNLKKGLKKYINIDFQLDCKNSNPLLLNYFILQSKGITIKDSISINRILYNYSRREDSPQSLHNVSENIHNLLTNSNIEKDVLAKITDDELLYIYLTSTGQLWDMMLEEHSEYNRSELKQAVFQQVFFSGSSRITKEKPLAGQFKEMFPSVYEFISAWKKPFSNEYMSHVLLEYGLASGDEMNFKEYSSLALCMMHLESMIMTNILKKMYSKRWYAVNIHDCIVVPKTRNKNHPTINDVKQIMDEVYAEFGLKATFN